MSELQRRLPHQEQKTLANPARGKRASSEPSLAIPKTTGHALGNQAAQGFAYSCPLRMPAPGRCPFGGVCHTCPVRPQAKLKVGQPGDEYEQEADRVAEQVMKMTKPKLPDACSEDAESLKCQRMRLGSPHSLLQTKLFQMTTDEETIAPPIIDQVLNLGGQPMDSAAKEFFEQRFRYSFDQVRIHTSTIATAAARAINAKAFTVGTNIVFGDGQYSPESHEGRRLLAHELVHSVQQGATMKYDSGRLENPLVRGNVEPKVQRNPIEIDQLPDCCLDGLRRIESVIDSFNAASIILSIAPAAVVSLPVSGPSAGVISRVMKALWYLARVGYSGITNRAGLQSLDVIARERVRTIIVRMMFDHQGEPDLHVHWERMAQGFE